MDKRGPRKSVVKCIRVGDHGDTSWYIELECGHSLQRNRSVKVDEAKISCKKCVSPSSGGIERPYYDDSFNHFDEIKSIAKIAAHFNVRMDQVQIARGFATIYLDSNDISKITGY